MFKLFLTKLSNFFENNLLAYVYAFHSKWFKKIPITKQYSPSEIESAGKKINQFISLHYHQRKAKKKLKTRENLSGEALDELHQKLKVLNKALSSRPPIPSKARMPRAEDKQALISKFEESYRPMVRDMLNEIQYISWAKFEAALKACIIKFNTELKLKKIDTYSVLLSDNTSTSWVFEHAAKYLDILPKHVYSVPKLLNMSSSRFKDQTLVIFDDWSISGSQLCQNLYYLYEPHDGHSNLHSYKHLFLIIPFMTIGAKKKVEQIISSPMGPFKECDMQLLTRGLIKTVHLTKGFCEKADKQYPKKMLQDYEVIFQTQLEKINSRALVFSDWKTPDLWSNLSCLGKGYVNLHASILAPYVGMRIEEVPKEIHTVYNREINVVPDTKPPYEPLTFEQLYNPQMYRL